MTVMIYEKTGCILPQILEFSWKDMIINVEASARTGQQKIKNVPGGL